MKSQFNKIMKMNNCPENPYNAKKTKNLSHNSELRDILKDLL